MKKTLVVTFAMLLAIFTMMPFQSYAATYANGTYDVNYQVNKPGSIDASIANDYFLKPAKVTVNNGSYTIQLTIKNSSWVTEFSPAGGATIVASNADADTRTVRFTAANPERVTIPMKIDIDDIDYHHSYSVDFVFDVASIPAPQAATEPAAANNEAASNEAAQNTAANNTQNNAAQSNAAANNATTNAGAQAGSNAAQNNTANNTAANADAEAGSNAAEGEQVANPQTSDAFPYVFIVLLLVSAVVFIRTKQTN